MSSGLQHTKFAALSRPACGVMNGNCLIITLPGSVKAVTEGWNAVKDVIPHAINLMVGHGDGLHPVQPGSTEEPLEQRSNHNHSCTHHTVAARPRSSPFPMVSFETALEIIKKNCKTLPSTQTSISNATGKVIAKSIKSPINVPAYRASIVDGYAMHSTSPPGIYPVHSVTTAGDDAASTLPKGHVCRVSTGSAVPEGADCVVMVEETLLESSALDGSEETIKILAKTPAGAGIRQVASDLRQGDVIIEAGRLVTSIGAEIALLASVGLNSVDCYASPIVGVMSTGNEVVDVTAEQVSATSVRDANRPCLLAALKAGGWDCIDLGIVRDDIDALSGALAEAVNRCHVVISTGGVSMGERDYLKRVVIGLGGRIEFGRVALKPGKPTTFATLPSALPGGGLLFALPGNPVSAIGKYFIYRSDLLSVCSASA